MPPSGHSRLRSMCPQSVRENSRRLDFPIIAVGRNKKPRKRRMTRSAASCDPDQNGAGHCRVKGMGDWASRPLAGRCWKRRSGGQVVTTTIACENPASRSVPGIMGTGAGFRPSRSCSARTTRAVKRGGPAPNSESTYTSNEGRSAGSHMSWENHRAEEHREGRA